MNHPVMAAGQPSTSLSVRPQEYTWAGRWPDVEVETAGLSLTRAHAIVMARAEGVLPFQPPEEPGDLVA